MKVYDYSNHLLSFEDTRTAAHAQKLIEEERKLQCAQMYNELGFISEKSKQKALRFLKNKGIVALEV